MVVANARSQNYDIVAKILLLGDSNVGKTCLLLRFAEETFNNSHMSTIGVDFKNKILKVDERRVKLQMWDSAGQERFRTITHSYYRHAHGFALVFDITDRGSFDNVSTWLASISERCPATVAVVLIGNKKDKEAERAVSRKEAESFAAGLAIPYFETSALSGDSVEMPFHHLAQSVAAQLPATAATNEARTASITRSPLFAGTLSSEKFGDYRSVSRCC